MRNIQEATSKPGYQDVEAFDDAGACNSSSLGDQDRGVDPPAPPALALNRTDDPSPATQEESANAGAALPSPPKQNNPSGSTSTPTCHRQPTSSVQRDETPRFFGLPKYTATSTGKGGIADYRDMYPEDSYGAELGENARVWRVYLDESGQFDDDMIRGFRDTLDVHLVFAALFSAVVTTFVVQTSQSLQPDYGRITSAILLEIVALQRARSPDDVPSANMTLDTLSVSSGDVWVNALWFTTLGLSLSTVLIAVLVKQWLQEYIKTPSGPPQRRALIRHMRYKELLRWKIPLIINLIPVLLHASLALFLAGLIVFLSKLSIPVTCLVSVLTGATYIFYIAAHVLGSLHWECPYRTPVTLAIRSAALCVSRKFMTMVVRFLRKVRVYPASLETDLPLKSPAQPPLNSIQGYVGIPRLHRGLQHQRAQNLMADSMSWLHSNAINLSAQSVIAAACAGLDSPLSSSNTGRSTSHMSDLPTRLNLRSILIEDLNDCVQQGGLRDERDCLALERATRGLLGVTGNLRSWTSSRPSADSVSTLLSINAEQLCTVVQSLDPRIAITGGKQQLALISQRILAFIIFSPEISGKATIDPLLISQTRQFIMNPSTKLAPMSWHLLLDSSCDRSARARAFLPDCPPILCSSGGSIDDMLSTERHAVQQWLDDVLYLVHACCIQASGSYRPGEEPATLRVSCTYHVNVKHRLAHHLRFVLGANKSWAEALTILVTCLERGKRIIPLWLKGLLWNQLQISASQFHANINELQQRHGGSPRLLIDVSASVMIQQRVEEFCVITLLHEKFCMHTESHERGFWYGPSIRRGTLLKQPVEHAGKRA